ncbi:MAG: hypothetical protein ACLUFA_07000 [[Clostridium] leptum]
MLDEINIQSNRVDGIEQFVQSLTIFYNCQLGEDENGNQVTPAYIRQQERFPEITARTRRI